MSSLKLMRRISQVEEKLEKLLKGVETPKIRLGDFEAVNKKRLGSEVDPVSSTIMKTAEPDF